MTILNVVVPPFDAAGAWFDGEPGPKGSHTFGNQCTPVGFLPMNGSNPRRGIFSGVLPTQSVSGKQGERR
jgi:hypothetical protein